MPFFDQFKEIISHDKKQSKKGKNKLSNFEKRLILVGAAVILALIAIVILLLGALSRPTAMESCSHVIFTAQRYDCYATLAYTTSNSSMCSFVGVHSRYVSCVESIAEKTDNVTTCSKIESSSSQYSNCVENISYSQGQQSDCNLLGQPEQSSCTYSIAQKDGFDSINDCNQIYNTSMRNLCDYIYDYVVATGSNKPSYCSLLPNDNNDTVLYAMLSNGGSNYSAEGIDDYSYSALNITPRSFCYYKTAVLLNNQSYCGNVSGPLNQVCIYSFNQSNSAINYSLNLSNANTICAEQNASVQELCRFGLYTDMAISSKNVSVCLQLNNSGYQYSCVENIAAKYNDSSYCNYISGNASAEQACVEDLSKGAGINSST